jgi:AcrR family transcriptional regulator
MTAVQAPITGDATRMKLIEGASACFYRYGVNKTTIDDVAREVGLSRRTVYRYFENRNQLFVAVVNSEMEDLSREGRLIYESSPFGEGLVEVALMMTRRVAESPTLSRLFSVDQAGETFEVLFGGPEFTALVERFLAPLMRRAQKRGELRTDISISDGVEWINHLVYSLLSPNPVIRRHDDDHVRFMLRTFVLPGLVPQPAGDATPAQEAVAAASAKRPSRTASGAGRVAGSSKAAATGRARADKKPRKATPDPA